ncbi:MAG: penicillin-binding protein 2 [Actinomycetota bacterium]|nr:penicillin-binding protein 2 [Actinomycetota bacterium]
MLRLIDRRIGLLFAAFLFMLACALAKAGWLGVVRADDLRNAAVVQQNAVIDVPAQRGTIEDAGGQVLAVSEPAVTVTANPYLIEDPAKVARALSPLLGKPLEEVVDKLTQPETGFVYLAQKIPGDKGRKIKDLGFNGIDLVAEHRRRYPRAWSASQVLGTVGAEGKGLAGLEYSLDRTLHGRDGKRQVVKDGAGAPLSLRERVPAVPGKTVRLTLDAAIQDRTEEVLAEVGRQWSPKGATAIVMDPRDGSVLALANWPRVNANDLGDAPEYAMQNRAVGATYEPGSTFKAFTVASGLEDGKITPQTSFYLPPTLQVADREIKESHPRGPVTYTPGQILEKSSNVGAVKIGLLQGRERFHHWIERLGFGRPTGIDLPGEERGIVLPLDRYSDSTMGNLPLGQGISVTPMQMASAYAALANGGMLRPPRIVSQIDGVPQPAPEGRRVMSPETARAVSRMLEGVTGPGGTASGADIPGYVLAGKTGTSQVAELGGYSESKYVASFVGFAPARNPRLLVSVMVDQPSNEIYGGLVAAPAFKQITSFALSYRGIPPE